MQSYRCFVICPKFYMLWDFEICQRFLEISKTLRVQFLSDLSQTL